MKRSFLTAIFILGLLQAGAQSEKSSDVRFELGKGLNISFNEGQNNFTLGGYIQSNALYENIKDGTEDFNCGIKRAYLSLGGDLYAGKLSFLLQMNYVDSYPLLDAWIGYRPVQWLKMTVGQKQSFSGTRSMMFYDYALALGDRSLSDRTFFASGREFGVFFESRIPIGQMGMDLGVAVTSGDGRNAFGTTTADFDSGGLKYSGRASLYPLGFFKHGNDLTDTDFARENCVKIALGGAYSYNDGTSSYNGEGYGDFVMYDKNGKFTYPGYQKVSADFMLKYRGLTLLAEYINATANGLGDLYTGPSLATKLQPHVIGDYLKLGNGVTAQAGYLMRCNWAVDARYSKVRPEWSDKEVRFTTTEAYTLGVSKYFVDNRVKLQLLGSYKDMPDLAAQNKAVYCEFLAHIVF